MSNSNNVGSLLSNDDDFMGDDSSEVVVGKKPRKKHISPRTNAFDEVLAMIKSETKDLEGDESLEDVLANIAARVEGMKSEKKTPDERCYYVFEGEDGSRARLELNGKVSRQSHGGILANCSKLYGSFRLRASAELVVKNGATDGTPVAIE